MVASFLAPGQAARGWHTRETTQNLERLKHLTFHLEGIAHKRGVAVFICQPSRTGVVPDYLQRSSIARRVAGRVHHYLIIHLHSDKQIWQWGRRSTSGEFEFTETVFQDHIDDDRLVKSLSLIAFSLDEEPVLTLVDVISRLVPVFERARKPLVQFRVRLDQIDMADLDDGIRYWMKYAYEVRGLTRQQEVAIGEAARAGSKAAKERLVQTHLYLVLEMAWKWKIRKQYANVEIGDLIQEGNIGLIKAASTFLPSRGQRFQNHAGFWIHRQFTRMQQEQVPMIRIPVYLDDYLSKNAEGLDLAYDTITQNKSSPPTEEDIAEHLGIPIETLKMIRARESDTILFSDLEEEELFDILDSIEGAKMPSKINIIQDIIIKEDLLSILAELSIRERTIIELRLGLNGGEEMTLEEIGNNLHITRERVRQIESRTLKKVILNAKNRGILE